MYRSRLGTMREREAEELAFDLLMPRALIREFRSAGGTSFIRRLLMAQRPVNCPWQQYTSRPLTARRVALGRILMRTRPCG
jgi:hypothetical protein